VINRAKSSCSSVVLLFLFITGATVSFFPATVFAQDTISIGIATDCQYCDCEESGVRQYRLSPAKLDSCISVFNAHKLDLVFHLGDLIDHNFESFDSVLPRFKKSTAPVKHVLGNHDWMVRREMRGTVLDRIGLPSGYYTITLGSWKFIVLNGNDLSYFAPQTRKQKDERDSLVVWLAQNFRANPMPWNGGVGREQRRWLVAELEKARQDHQKVIVLNHFPFLPKAGHNLWNDQQMVALLSVHPCVKACFNGHYHPGNYALQNGIHFVTFKGMVDTKENAFATVTLTPDSIIIHGYGRQPGYRLKISDENADGSDAGMGSLILADSTATDERIVQLAARVTPSGRQLAWQKTGFNAFVHFGLNTFYNSEWGEGAYDPGRFNPSALDANQWVKTFRDAGMKMVIITAKHHDGFCLWPSKYTTHSVAASPWRDGKGDVVGELAAACKAYGLKFGVYLSPWDRHEPSYGNTPAYNQFFRNQLTELLTNYGPVGEVWFDGACGEGPNGQKQVYDWPSYYKIIRELQPDAVIAVMGPDVRWVGTESGYGRDTEWSVLPGTLYHHDSIAAASQQAPDEDAFVPRDLMAEDLGSRGALKHARSLVWYPAETDVSIRPGWFYHPREDTLVKSAGKLVDIYFNSVGKNGVLLLNVPPDTLGLISRYDVQSLMGMRAILDATFAKNFIDGAKRIENDSVFEFLMDRERTFDVALVAEEISSGQRVERFRLEAWDGRRWQVVARGTTVGYKRLLRFPQTTASRVRLVIEQARAKPSMADFGLYLSPGR
jgi:alpha-L-fucosidase